MSKKRIEIEVVYRYTIEIDESSSIIKEHDTEKELIDDLVRYRFTTLPVLNNGVEIRDVEAVNWMV